MHPNDKTVLSLLKNFEGKVDLIELVIQRCEQGEISDEVRELICLAGDGKMPHYNPDLLRSFLSDFASDISEEIREAFVKLMDTQVKIKERRLSKSWPALKESMLERDTKTCLILADWLTKWASYLQKEQRFNPSSIMAYKQGDIVLVEFGWRVGAEFGGRHYAIVLEKNNNPKNPLILLVPMSSYNPAKRKPHPSNVILGKCIGSTDCFAVMSQIGYYSKIRIERPLSTSEKIGKISAANLEEIKLRLLNTIGIVSKVDETCG